SSIQLRSLRGNLRPGMQGKEMRHVPVPRLGLLKLLNPLHDCTVRCYPVGRDPVKNELHGVSPLPVNTKDCRSLPAVAENLADDLVVHRRSVGQLELLSRNGINVTVLRRVGGNRYKTALAVRNQECPYEIRSTLHDRISMLPEISSIICKFIVFP